MARVTRQRVAIADVLAQTDEFRSAQQLHEALRDGGDAIGLATVYRTLQALADQGDVDVLRSPEGEVLYRQCERREHHHHLMCRSCGRTVEIDGPSVEAWAEQIGASHGFADIDHTLELVGTCTGCARTTPRTQ